MFVKQKACTLSPNYNGIHIMKEWDYITVLMGFFDCWLKDELLLAYGNVM